jgi:hypothetical protein
MPDKEWAVIKLIAEERSKKEGKYVSATQVVEEALEEHVRAWNAAHGKATLKRITDLHGGKYGKRVVQANEPHAVRRCCVAPPPRTLARAKAS